MEASNTMTRGAVAAALVLGTSAAISGHAAAQSLSDEWRFHAIIYLWAPRITGTATFPVANIANIEVPFQELLKNLKMAGMGTLEAQKGRWGAFTDFVYVNVGTTKTHTRDGTIDGVPLPVGVTANAGMDIKNTIWTLGGSYRVQATPESELDVLAGARMLTVEPRLTWDFNADVGPFTGPSRVGGRTVKETDWDGIVGVKGRARFGSNNEWFVPYYVDVGTGNSDFTWQISGGIGYAYPWGELIATWRYLDYKFKSDSKLEDLTVNGPLFGVAFRW
jgi:hypothetical protein